MSWRKIAITLTPVLAVLALLVYGLVGTDPKERPSTLVHGPAPNFRLRSFGGEEIELARLRGKGVVLNFWASWCKPACYREAPHLQAAWEKYRDRGIMVLGVDIQDKDEEARKFIKRFGFTFPNMPDPKGLVSIDYGMYGVPETFFIDPKGVIAGKHIGVLTAQSLEAAIQNILPGGVGPSGGAPPGATGGKGS